MAFRLLGEISVGVVLMGGPEFWGPSWALAETNSSNETEPNSTLSPLGSLSFIKKERIQNFILHEDAALHCGWGGVGPPRGVPDVSFLLRCNHSSGPGIQVLSYWLGPRRPPTT